MGRPYYSTEFKWKVVQEYKNEGRVLEKMTKKYGVHHSTVKKWAKIVEKEGKQGLNKQGEIQYYSKERKRKAIRDYLSGNYSVREVTEMHDISDASVLRNWLKKYNRYRERQARAEERGFSMTVKRRPTAMTERIEIVKFALYHDKDYQYTADMYGVSYQQVYQWIRKYEAKGWDGLQDRRGKPKPWADLTKEEKLKRENREKDKENERLRAEVAFLKKWDELGEEVVTTITRVRHEHLYQVIQQLQKETAFSICLLCEVAGVNRGAYHRWLIREDTEEDQFNRELLQEIRKLYDEWDQAIGYLRMTSELKRKFEHPINHKRIYRLMDIEGIKAVIRRKTRSYIPSRPEHTAANILNREFHADKPNEKWLTDVTEFKYGKGNKAYLSAILDLNENRIVAFKIRRANNNELVFDTLIEALNELSDGEHPLIHTDRGVQYTSYGFKRIVENAGLQHSMSRPGKCIDNGPMEGFWSSLKCEKYYLHQQEYQTFSQLVQAITEYIHFYNYERLQLTLNGYTPMECFENTVA
ncbi:IS3 family transposase [Gracilibacillus salinarum]|uniref:IS3 family transposase n=1 Tax=Gracilibacillus salinarum TaxID=2932255 RepID=A0ABY4GQQ2_9BACI|nr:IS3 family transposase [Gracilibacillus salinarum]UOQ86460.1 IS3 family transposase [Gracilibacillus salinarum]